VLKPVYFTKKIIAFCFILLWYHWYILTHSRSLDLQFVSDLEIERTLRRLRAEIRRAEMAEEEQQQQHNHTLLDYLAPPNQTIRSAIRIPTIQANSFEMWMPLF